MLGDSCKKTTQAVGPTNLFDADLLVANFVKRRPRVVGGGGGVQAYASTAQAEYTNSTMVYS